MIKSRAKYNYYEKQDLKKIDELIIEAKEGVRNPKRTWKDVSSDLKRNIKKGFPAIAGLGVFGATFLVIIKETKSLLKAIVAATIAFISVLCAFFVGKKRQDGITEDELAKFKEVVKYQNEIIEKQNTIIKNSKEREIKLLRIIKDKDNTHFSDEHINYLNRIEKSLAKVAKKLKDDLMLEGVNV